MTDKADEQAQIDEQAMAFDAELSLARAEMAARHSTTSGWWHRPQGAITPSRELAVSSMSHDAPND